MGTLVQRTRMYISNVNPRKEGKGEGMSLASDVSVEFTAQRMLMDQLIPDQQQRFSNQFYDDQGSPRLALVYPICHHQKMRHLRVSIWFGNKPTVFEGAILKDGTEMTPDEGGYLTVKAKLQLHPTSQQSGMLDNAVKEWVEVEIDDMSKDIEDEDETENAGAEAAVA